MERHDRHAPHRPKGLPITGQKLEKDPVCGMTVPADAPLRTTHAGRTYVFCSEHCLARFEKEPARYVPAAEAPPPAAAAQQPAPAGAPTQWTCPMHPQIVRDKPGTCPICGMALEPRSVVAQESENPELVPIAAGVLYPVFGLLLTPVMAAAAMAFSSVSVIGNALRLRRADV